MKNVEGLNKESQVNFFYDGQGFMSVQLNPTQAEIEFYDVFGNVLHSWTASKQLLLLHPSI
jgi:tartrate-resistant acid phosphatase type 5